MKTLYNKSHVLILFVFLALLSLFCDAQDNNSVKQKNRPIELVKSHDFNILMKKFPKPSPNGNPSPLLQNVIINKKVLEIPKYKLAVKGFHLVGNSSIIIFYEVNKKQQMNVYITIDDSYEKTYKSLMRSILIMREHFSMYIDIEEDISNRPNPSQDYFYIYSQDRFVCFNRFNAVVAMNGSASQELLDYLAEHIDKYLQTMPTVAIVSDKRFTIVLESEDVGNSNKYNMPPYERKNISLDEKLEQELKSMSKEDAQKHCLEKGAGAFGDAR